jgi:plastocyanin
MKRYILLALLATALVVPSAPLAAQGPARGHARPMHMKNMRPTHTVVAPIILPVARGYPMPMSMQPSYSSMSMQPYSSSYYSSYSSSGYGSSSQYSTYPTYTSYSSYQMSTSPSSSAPAFVVKAHSVVDVRASDNSFNPKSITVTPGTVVRWVNHGKEAHTVTSKDGLFDSGTLSPGAKFHVYFYKPGTYHYVCRSHGKKGMEGTVVVSDETASTGTGNATSGH